MRVFIGTAGFSYKDWEGAVYPLDLKKRKVHPLEYFAQYFDCCEINTSFYGHVRPNVAESWCEKVAAANADFQFTAKMNKAFTHAAGGSRESTSAFTIKPTKEDEELMRAGFDALAARGRLGAVLAQFPISFKNEDHNRDYLFELVRRFREYPLVVEIRHASWDDRDVLGRLAEAGVAFCNIDQPRLGQSLRATAHVTSPVGYVRLHGRNFKEWFQADNRDDRYRYLYKPKELEGWKEKIETIGEQAEKTFVVTNNHPNGRAAVNALQLKKMLTGKKVKAPEPLVEKYPAELEGFVE